MFFLIAFLSTFVFSQTNHERLQQITSIKRIAFGSCNNQMKAQPLWEDVREQKPNLWIWGGDNVYADWFKSYPLQFAYWVQGLNVEYNKFKKEIPIIGTWDDHDYGWDEANGYYKYKKESQKLHLDFMEVPSDSPRRSREGVYTTHQFGKVKIIILDNRYFKDLDPSAPLLGEAQWQWLENELKYSTAHLHFFVSGISVVSPSFPVSEEWWDYPKELDRLRNLLSFYQVKAPLFLTGDKHYSSIFKYWGQLEFLSSGMNEKAHRTLWWYISRKYPQIFFGYSYGVVDIDWDGDTPKLTMFIRNGARDILKTKVIWKNGKWGFIN